MITNESNVEETAVDQIMDALGDKTRREILALLKEGSMAVGDIAERLPISRPAVSKHLRILDNAGLVSYTSSGTRNIFRINTAGFEQARGYLDTFEDEALMNFQQFAELEGTQQTTGAVYKTIVVGCDVATAFRLWTEQINTWWPKSYSRSGEPNTTVFLERRVGGRLYERASLGVEYDWGEVLVWEPPYRFAYYWYLGSGPKMPTRVNVQFSPQEAGMTRIEVTHRGPELIGELWFRNNARYDASWDTVLVAYAAVADA